MAETTKETVTGLAEEIIGQATALPLGRKTLLVGPSVILRDEPEGLRVDVGRCKDCKHWGNLFRPGQPTHARFCERVENSEEMSDMAVATSLAVTSDYAGLVTMPNFGCVLFEAKEAT